MEAVKPVRRRGWQQPPRMGEAVAPGQRERGGAGREVPEGWTVGREEKGGVGRVCWRSHLWRRLCGGARGC